MLAFLSEGFRTLFDAMQARVQTLQLVSGRESSRRRSHVLLMGKPVKGESCLWSVMLLGMGIGSSTPYASEQTIASRTMEAIPSLDATRALQFVVEQRKRRNARRRTGGNGNRS